MTLDTWQSNTVDVNGLRLHYTRTGLGSGKPSIVLAHGFSDDGLCYAPIAEQLATTYDVIMVDARHHGRSDSPAQPFTIIDLADDLAGVIIGLGLEHPIVMGHSLGAVTSFVMAGRYPQIPSAIVLEDPPPWWSESAPPPFTEDWQAGSRKWLLPLKQMERPAILAKQRAEMPTWPEGEFEPWADSKLRLNMNVVDCVRPADIHWPNLLGQVACPVLLITADTSLGAIVSPANATEFQALVPQAQVAHIPNAGHSIRRDQPSAFMAALYSFLADIAPKP